jgi:hypothetical protein
MSKQTTEPGVVEGGCLQKRLKMRRTTKVSLGDDIGAGLFIGGWRVRSHRRRVIGNSVPEQSASFSPISSNLLGSGSHE